MPRILLPSDYASKNIMTILCSYPHFPLFSWKDQHYLSEAIYYIALASGANTITSHDRLFSKGDNVDCLIIIEISYHLFKIPEFNSLPDPERYTKIISIYDLIVKYRDNKCREFNYRDKCGVNYHNMAMRYMHSIIPHLYDFKNINNISDIYRLLDKLPEIKIEKIVKIGKCECGGVLEKNHIFIICSACSKLSVS